MDEIRRAQLGDRDAQERLTERGVLLPCPWCNGTDIQVRKVSGIFGRSSYTRTYKYIQCRNCMAQTGIHGTEPKARKAWNTRATILSAEELEAIDGKL